MKTCLSDDRPLWSLLGGAFWIATGTWNLWYSGILAEFGWTWLFALIALAQYGLGVYFLRNGASDGGPLRQKVLELLEPRWLR